ncbi:MAG: hypothetical protein HS115_18300 [Spirochaetales bacterium]|nr:hypothetical protein [Spirochaetales bacterium]
MKHLLIFLLILTNISSCLLTNRTGLIEPLGSVSGDDAIKDIQQTASTSFLLGVFGFCSQFDPPEDCLSGYSGSLATGLVFTRLIAQSRLGLDKDGSYIPASVVDCQKKFNVVMNLLTVNHLNGKKQCNFFTCVRASEGEVQNAALTNAIIASQLCKIEKTGNIISLYQFNLDLPFLQFLE